MSPKEFEAEVDDDKITEIKIRDTRVEENVTSKWLSTWARWCSIIIIQLKGCNLLVTTNFRPN